MTDQPPPSFDGPRDFSTPPPVGSGAGQPSTDDKTWALIAHLGQIVIGFVAPLIVMLTKGNESEWVRRESIEALNFSITAIIGFVVSAVLSVVIIGAFTGLAVWLAYVVFAIIAGVKSYAGESYRYPVNIRLVK